MGNPGTARRGGIVWGGYDCESEQSRVAQQGHSIALVSIDLRDLAPFEVVENEELLDRRIDTATVPLE